MGEIMSILYTVYSVSGEHVIHIPNAKWQQHSDSNLSSLDCDCLKTDRSCSFDHISLVQNHQVGDRECWECLK